MVDPGTLSQWGPLVTSREYGVSLIFPLDVYKIQDSSTLRVHNFKGPSRVPVLFTRSISTLEFEPPGVRDTGRDRSRKVVGRSQA